MTAGDLTPFSRVSEKLVKKTLGWMLYPADAIIAKRQVENAIKPTG